jgi:hypothetical protein
MSAPKNLSSRIIGREHHTIRHPFGVSDSDRGTPQGNIELMPKKEILDFKPAPRLATDVPSRWRMASIASDDALILPHRANPSGGIFGNDNPLRSVRRQFDRLDN